MDLCTYRSGESHLGMRKLRRLLQLSRRHPNSDTQHFFAMAIKPSVSFMNLIRHFSHLSDVETSITYHLINENADGINFMLLNSLLLHTITLEFFFVKAFSVFSATVVYITTSSFLLGSWNDFTGARGWLRKNVIFTALC